MNRDIRLEDAPVRYAAEVVREAITCDRMDCPPWVHTSFVEQNLGYARDAINEQATGGAA